MLDPDTYHETNKLQKKFAFETLTEYFPQILWRSDGKDTILDIGCADGTVTEAVLEPLIPKGYRKIVGIDINSEFIERAQKRNKNERISYKTMDIAGDNCGDLGEFDHILSFFVLHWVDNQRKAFENIYNLLAEGGDCLLIIAPNHTLHKSVKIVALMKQWKHCFKDYNLEAAPFKFLLNPEENLRFILKDVGFKNFKIETKPWAYDHGSMEAYRNFTKMFNTIGGRLNEEEYEKYIDDILEVSWILDNDPSKSTITRGDYIHVYAQK